jgi:hypothetical protein
MNGKAYTFFACWVEDTREPTYHHRTMAEAQKEAERLARLNAGKKVFILQAVCFALIELPLCTFSETNGVKPEELPF